MAEQLRHLADLSTKPNITVRVLPYMAGVPLGDLTGPFTIVDFAPVANGKHEPSVVYVENFTGAMYLERPGSVSRYRTAHETIGRVALNPELSRDLLRRTAREYERER